MKLHRILFFSVLMSVSVASVANNPKQYSSGVAPVPLLELYTSEGCSSCPPADRWLSSLKNNDGLWKSFIPLSFHVDYWDYLGWKDDFASPQFSQRQRRYAFENKESTVYTPGVRKQGEEWRQWRAKEGSLSNNSRAVGNLTLSLVDSSQFSASFSPLFEDVEQLQLTVALLGLDLESKVSRGENHGKILKHDFVVLGLTTIGSASKRIDDQGDVSWQGSLPIINKNAPRYAVAAWITRSDKLTPIQSVGGLL